MVDLRKIMKHNPADDENEDLDEDDEYWKKTVPWSSVFK